MKRRAKEQEDAIKTSKLRHKAFCSQLIEIPEIDEIAKKEEEVKLLKPIVERQPEEGKSSEENSVNPFPQTIVL